MIPLTAISDIEHITFPLCPIPFRWRLMIELLNCSVSDQALNLRLATIKIPASAFCAETITEVIYCLARAVFLPKNHHEYSTSRPTKSERMTCQQHIGQWPSGLMPKMGTLWNGRTFYASEFDQVYLSDIRTRFEEQIVPLSLTGFGRRKVLNTIWRKSWLFVAAIFEFVFFVRRNNSFALSFF
jgi:hypothetical protein